jgi:hypothetical protein
MRSNLNNIAKKYKFIFLRLMWNHRHVSVLGSRPFKPIFFKQFLNTYLVRAERNWFLYTKILYLFLHIVNNGFITCTERNNILIVFPIYSSKVLAPLIGWCNGQLPGWLAPKSSPACWGFLPGSMK